MGTTVRSAAVPKQFFKDYRLTECLTSQSKLKKPRFKVFSILSPLSPVQRILGQIEHSGVARSSQDKVDSSGSSKWIKSEAAFSSVIRVVLQYLQSAHPALSSSHSHLVRLRQDDDQTAVAC